MSLQLTVAGLLATLYQGKIVALPSEVTDIPRRDIICATLTPGAYDPLGSLAPAAPLRRPPSLKAVRRPFGAHI